MGNAVPFKWMVILNKRQQSVIAGNAIVKIEDILKKCGLENVLVTVNDKDYVALDEVKKAIRELYEGEEK